MTISDSICEWLDEKTKEIKQRREQTPLLTTKDFYQLETILRDWYVKGMLTTEEVNTFSRFGFNLRGVLAGEQ